MRGTRGFAVLLALTSTTCGPAVSSRVDGPTGGRVPVYKGVNLGSAAFAPDHVPGVYGKHYLYPDRATGRPFLRAGMNAVRLPVLWERLQPTALAPLDPNELARLDTSIAQLDDFALVIIDVHNYARFRGVLLTADDRSLPDLWSKLARHYRSNGKVAFGLMNEPHGLGAADWRSIADRSLSSIRATGATNLVLVPGVRWSGGHSWSSGGRNSNAVAMAGFKDPKDNFAFDIHQYLDANSSGTGSDCVAASTGTERLTAVTQWLRQQKASGFLGEFGVTTTPTCLAALDQLLAFLDRNGDAWIGWTYWTGGDWWGDYPYSIQPANGVDKPQLTRLRAVLKASP